MHRTVLSAVLLIVCVLGGAGCAARQAPPAPPSPDAVYRVQAGLLNLVKCPSVNCDVIEDLHAGQEVAVISPQMGGWVMVRVLATGHEGYAQVRFLGR